MHQFPPIPMTDEERLGVLAMQFRGTRRDSERHEIAREYTRAVHCLIKGGHWSEMPAPEDQLPDDWMPPAFFQYWLGRPGGP